MKGKILFLPVLAARGDSTVKLPEEILRPRPRRCILSAAPRFELDL